MQTSQDVNIKPSTISQLTPTLTANPYLDASLMTTQLEQFSFRSNNTFLSQHAINQHRMDTRMTRDAMISNLPRYVNGCYNSNPLDSVVSIRKMLSIERHPPIQEVIDSGIVPQIMTLLKNNAGKYEIVCTGYIREFAEQSLLIPDEIIRLCIIHCIDDLLQHECIWILTNISSGNAEQTAHIITNGAVPVLINALWLSSSIQVQTGAIWALGNISGDSPECRNLVLQSNILHRLLPIIDRVQSTHNIIEIDKDILELLRNTSWVLSNFGRGSPQPELKYIKVILQGLDALFVYNDTEILTNIAWAFSYLTHTNVNNVIYANKNVSILVPKLVNLLDNTVRDVRHPTIRAIGNIVAGGTDKETQTLLELGILPKIYQIMITDTSPQIHREICWLMSNILAGSKAQIQQVIDSKCVPWLIQVLKTAKYEVAKEALWAIANTCSGGNNEQIEFVVTQGALAPICEFLDKTPNNKCRMVALECIENILNAGQANPSQNLYVLQLEQCGGRDILEGLCANEEITNRVYEKVHCICAQYFGPQPMCTLVANFGTKEVCARNDMQSQSVPKNDNLLKDYINARYDSLSAYTEAISNYENIWKMASDKRIILANGYWRANKTNEFMDGMSDLFKEVPIEILRMCDNYYYFEVMDHTETDMIYEELQWSFEPVRAWRWDTEQSKWRGRGKGEIRLYCNRFNRNEFGDLKLLFIDKKHEKTRLLQYISKTSTGEHSTETKVESNEDKESVEILIIEDCVEWDGEDFTMDKNVGMFARWKLKFLENVNDESTHFLQLINSRK